MTPSPFYEDEDDYTDDYDYIENPSFPELSPAGTLILSFVIIYKDMHRCIHKFIYVRPLVVISV
jgi:hypothetical protein